MVADRAAQARAEVFLHEVEVRAALPVDEVAGVDDIVDVLLRPGKRIAQRLLLAPAEGLRADLAQLLLLRILVRIRGREVRVGDVQHGKRLLQADVDVLVGKDKTFELAARGKDGRIVLADRRQRRDGDKPAEKASSCELHGPSSLFIKSLRFK